MLTNPGLLIDKQLPEFLAADIPKFVDFLNEYYKFAEGYNVRIESLRDVDEIADRFLIFFRQEFVARFPQAAINDRRLISVIRELYQLKGTFDSFKFLFRIFFNEAITVIQPNKQMLRASDGRWFQENSITLEQVYIKPGETVDFNEPIELKVTNSFGTFFIEVDRAVAITGTRTRFYYRSFRSINLVDDQYIDIVDTDGSLIYRGQLVKEPARISILSPGKYWRVGQVFKIPGTTATTIGVIRSVGPQGQALSAEIIEFGYEHTDGQIELISPFPNKPVATSTSLEITVIDYDPGTSTFIYQYDLSVDDYITQIGESIIGLSDAQDYILDDYVARGYVGKTEFVQFSQTAAPPPTVLIDPELTIEKWIESVAAFQVVFDYEVKYPGRYLGIEGQLSMPIIRLQDNFFYQLFSYAIESTHGIEEWRIIANQIHPAGLKMFSQLAKTADIDRDDMTITRDLYNDGPYWEVQTSAAGALSALRLIQTSGGILYSPSNQVQDSTGTSYTVDTL